MQKNSVSEALRALATGEKARSETARLKDVFNDVEAALEAGVSRAAILEALHGQGFTMTLKSFESAIYRIRKQREKKGGGLSSTNGKEPVSSATPSTEKPGATESSQAAQMEVGEGGVTVDDLAGLDKKQRREKVADQYIKENANPLLKRIKEQDK